MTTTAPSDGDLAQLFIRSLLAKPTPADDRPRPAAPYEGLRHLQALLDEKQPLIADRLRLRSLLELCAISDPRLFHAMFLHHCMTIGTALDQGACQEDVAALASGEWIGAALMNETGCGNSSSAVRTEARYDPARGDFVLHTPTPEAAKGPANVGLDGFARLAVVSARLVAAGTDRGTALFLVALRDEDGPCPGVAIEALPPVAQLPMDYATVRFDHVRVPRARWLADGAWIAEDGSFHDPLETADARTRRSLGMARFCWGAISAGLAAVARGSAALALTHARHRRTADRLAGQVPALNHLGQQRLLFGATAQALAATAVAHRATRRSWHIPPGGGRGSGPDGSAMRELALAKVTTDTLADAAVTRCRSAGGTAAFFSLSRLGCYQSFTQTYASAGGDNRMILLDAAWTMATGQDYQPPDETSAPDDHTRLLRARERLLHTELTAHLPQPADTAVTFDIWNERTELAQRFALAHAARTTAETLHEKWHTPTLLPAPDRALLADLYQLHCLEQIDAHSGWYLAHGLLTAQQVLALPEQADQACRRLAPHAQALTELLQVPDALLHGPLHP
ncbi:acyl-CoA dehydrogenase [Streptomyces sp. NRRL WC-3742]|uniref:acyl-CoA dehydrogenase n=1 Tax=Streptomyces sp. NRRL WC-3742 TaxID=1463934 RepID=UPI00068B77FB|nr:acyl-CoA dehydrogenase [Streptomyces sp. NRRL WC-3742]